MLKLVLTEPDIKKTHCCQHMHQQFTKLVFMSWGVFPDDRVQGNSSWISLTVKQWIHWNTAKNNSQIVKPQQLSFCFARQLLNKIPWILHFAKFWIYKFMLNVKIWNENPLVVGLILTGFNYQWHIISCQLSNINQYCMAVIKCSQIQNIDAPQLLNTVKYEAPVLFKWSSKVCYVL